MYVEVFIPSDLMSLCNVTIFQRESGELVCYAMRAKVNSSIHCTACESSFLCVCSTAAAAAAAAARSGLQLGVFYLLRVWRILICSWKDVRYLSQMSQKSSKLQNLLLMIIWENNWQKSSDLLIVHLLHQGRQLQMEENTCCLPSGGGEGCFWSKVRQVKQRYENVKEEDCSITKL